MVKVLFISHDANRTGAPILLLNLAKLLKSEKFEINFLLKHGGPLEADFNALGPTQVFFKPVKNNTIDKIKRHLLKVKPGHFSLSKLNFSQYNYIISNTITNGDIVPLVRNYYRGPIFSYIHELEMATSFFTSKEAIEQVIQCTDFFLVPSLAVQNFLINSYRIDKNRIGLLHYYIPPAEQIADAMLPEENTCFIVGGVGTIDWRKSPDLFIQVAATVFRKCPHANIKFFWKGAPEESIELKRLLYDIRKTGLDQKVIVKTASADMKGFYKSLSLLLLTSREDPYPLVVLEAADAGVPTVCFKGAGGAEEFIENAEGGVSVDYLNVEAMADAILYFYNHEQERKEAGNKAKRKLLETHQNTTFIAGQFVTILKQVQAGNVR